MFKSKYSVLALCLAVCGNTYSQSLPKPGQPVASALPAARTPETAASSPGAAPGEATTAATTAAMAATAATAASASTASTASTATPPASAAAASNVPRPTGASVKTIDDLVHSGQLRRASPDTLPLFSPRADTGAPVQSAAWAPAPLAGLGGHGNPGSNLQVLTTFEAVGLAHAQLRVAGSDVLVAVGDRIRGGWQVRSISAGAVVLQRCLNKKCHDKTLYLGED